MPLQPRYRPTLFLDMDGVVTRNEGATIRDRMRPACIARLEALVRATDCRVVLSSTWRTTWTAAQCRNALGWGGYTGTIDDVTPVLDGQTRGAEIRAWLDAHPGEVDGYVILDDHAPPGEFAGMADHLVETRYDDGLTDADCARVVAMFAAQRVEAARRTFMGAHAALPRTVATRVEVVA